MILLYDRKRAYMLIIMIVAIIALSFSISYAYRRDEVQEVYTVTKENLVLTFDSGNNIIAPLDFIPDTQTPEVPSYKFTIKNITSDEFFYNIMIKLNSNVDSNLLPYIMVQIDDSPATYLNEKLEDEGYNVYLNSLNSRVANTHEIKMWLSNKDKIGNELLSINHLEVNFSIDAIVSDYTPTFITNIEEKLDNSQDLFKDEHGNIRYYGLNPNNYVSFNNEVWRMIGIIKTNTENGEKNLVKLIRPESIGELSFDYKADNNYANNYKESSLINILNSEGYWNMTSIACPNYRNRNAICDFTTSGLTDESKKLIEPIVYNQGGWHLTSISASSIYLKEKSASQNKETASVILASPSDYGYAAGSMFQNVYLDSFDKSAKSYNWLYSEQSEWLFAPNTEDYKKAFSVEESGLVVIKDNVVVAKNIRPVVYLREDLILVDGTGSIEDPYQLEINEK